MKYRGLKNIIALCSLFFIMGFVSKAQVPSSYEFSLRNDIQISPTVFEFDIYLQNNDLAHVFELDLFQAGILVNAAILNGGTITPSIVAGSSQLVTAQQPTTAIQFASNCIKLANPGLVSHGGGTIIPTTAPGIRVATIRLTNTVAFGQASPNLAFNFTSTPYNTAVYAFDQTSPFLGVNLTNASYFTTTHLTNGVLNGPPVTLSISGVTAVSKTYDGTPDATLSVGSAALVGVVGADIVNLSTAGATGSFADKNVGPSKTVSTSGFTISGASAWKYTLTQPSTTASITPASLSITGVSASNKIYDATSAAVINTAGAALSGIIGSDVVTLNSTGATGSFLNKVVGNSKTVNTSGFLIGGTDAVNYTLSQPSTSANITPAALTITGVTANSKVYDRSVTATLVTTSASLSGILLTDIVNLSNAGATGSFTNFNVGTAKTVNTAGFAISGTDALNYSLSQPSTTADITPKALSVTANNQAKCFGETFLFTGTEFTSIGIISGDAVASTTITSAGAGASALAANYPIAPSAATGTGLSNYTINYFDGVFTVNAIPPTPVISQNLYTLNSDAPTGNQWYNSITGLLTGATNQSYDVSVEGNYWTIVTINGCSSVSSNIINIVFTGVDELSAASEIDIYPVPNSGKFSVSFNSISEKKYDIFIYDAIGTLIFTENDIIVNGKLDHKIDISTAPMGTYYIQLRSENDQLIKKILIVR